MLISFFSWGPSTYRSNYDAVVKHASSSDAVGVTEGDWFDLKRQ